MPARQAPAPFRRPNSTLTMKTHGPGLINTWRASGTLLTGPIPCNLQNKTMILIVFVRIGMIVPMVNQPWHPTMCKLCLCVVRYGFWSVHGLHTEQPTITDQPLDLALFGQLGVDLVQDYFLGRPRRHPTHKSTPVSPESRRDRILRSSMTCVWRLGCCCGRSMASGELASCSWESLNL